MSNRLWSADRCALCGKVRGHPIHDARPPMRWWERLVRLAWPTFIHGEVAGAHLFSDASVRVEMSNQMAVLRRRIQKMRRLS